MTPVWCQGVGLDPWKIGLNQRPLEARVPVSLWWCGGWAVFARRCATVRNRPQPFATLRNRSQPSATVRARAVLQKGWYFWSFPASHNSISRGKRGTLWHFNILHDMTKVVFLCPAQYFCDVFKRCVACFVASSALWRPPMSFCVASAALEMCRVPCFFCIVSAARDGDKVQIPWQPWHFVTCHENRRKLRTKRRCWGRFVRKLVGKRRFWSCEVWNLRKSRTKCSFWCSNMSCLELLASLMPSQCLLGEAAKPLPVEGFKTGWCSMLICRFAWQAWHFLTFSRVENRSVRQAQYFCVAFRRWFAVFVAVAALWRPPMSCCLAGATL